MGKSKNVELAESSVVVEVSRKSRCCHLCWRPALLPVPSQSREEVDRMHMEKEQQNVDEARCSQGQIKSRKNARLCKFSNAAAKLAS